MSNKCVCGNRHEPQVSQEHAGTKLEKAIKADPRTPDQEQLVAAGQEGDRMTLKADSAIPATMAVIYLLIILYFKSIGGYKPLTIDPTRGGEPGPSEA